MVEKSRGENRVESKERDRCDDGAAAAAVTYVKLEAVVVREGRGAGGLNRQSPGKLMISAGLLEYCCWGSDGVQDAHHRSEDRQQPRERAPARQDMKMTGMRGPFPPSTPATDPRTHGPTRPSSSLH